MVAIIDYGFGNLGSIANMLKVIGERNIITDSKETIASADKIILPGVGAFDAGMRNLKEKGLVEAIKTAVLKDRKPLLGICLGMQLLGEKSEEGGLKGLELIPFTSQKFQFSNETALKIPHMGWDIVSFQQNHPLTTGLEGRQRYYFVHSYHAVCEHKENILMTCDYGYEFAAAVVKDNIMGVQFHPEKSHDFGMNLLKNFTKNF